MKRILFLVLWVILVFQALVYAQIEIYANGHKYNSLQEYLASKKSAKTFQGHQKNSFDAALHELYVLSIENGMVDALQDFYGTLANRSITPQQLQEAIQQAVTRSKGPKLLISEPGKVRIMTPAK